MNIKSYGGVFGRNPTFNNVEIEGNLEVGGTLSIGGSVITGLNYQGAWNASTNTPDLPAASPNVGDFWIVSVAGSTNLGGITSWSQGDWALYDGAAWQRVEGRSVDLSTGVDGDDWLWPMAVLAQPMRQQLGKTLILKSVWMCRLMMPPSSSLLTLVATVPGLRCRHSKV